MLTWTEEYVVHANLQGHQISTGKSPIRSHQNNPMGTKKPPSISGGTPAQIHRARSLTSLSAAAALGNFDAKMDLKR